jgi:hypothetical protein
MMRNFRKNKYFSGFDQNYNLLMPFLMKNCADDDKSCKDDRKDIMMIMLAMQTQAPNSSMSANSMVPLMMMSDKENNEDLIMNLELSRPENRC